MEMSLPNSKKEVNGGNCDVFNSNRYLAAYHWKALLLRNIMTLNRGC